MANQVQIQSYEQILGAMIRKIIAGTNANDLNPGSVILTLLEAASTNDFNNNVAILNVLELMNIGAIRNNDLDAYAANFGLTRLSAQKSSGFVTISNSNITKQSTQLFPIKLPPIKGATQIYVSNASGWNTTGTFYIGRETSNFEGPIQYNNIINNGTYYTIVLTPGHALGKDHLISDTVINGQGQSDRLIASGTVVYIPANNVSPRVNFVTLRDAVLPAGEDTVSNVEVIAAKSGSLGNAGINNINTFDSIPFSGATITNPYALTNGTDTESDDDFRDRIKNFPQTLARGTKGAILSSILNLSDTEENKRVYSAVITEPASISEPSILYIDDGSGFQPSFSGQSVDILLNEASGHEEFLQLSNFPLPRAQVINAADGPYQLSDGSILKVTVDNDQETVYFNDDDFANISSATLPEIVAVINDQALLFKARLTENSTRLLIYTSEFDAESIQVMPIDIGSDISLYSNNVLKFPTSVSYYIKLYKNNEPLKEKDKSATINTSVFANWNIAGPGPYTLSISVDGTPAQSHSFSSTDFDNVSWQSLTLDNWVEVFNTKFAGLTASALTSGQMQIKSNKIGITSSIEVMGGDLFAILFSASNRSAVGQTAQFELNRQNGNIRILDDLIANDMISAGIEDTKGYSISTASDSSGQFDLTLDGTSRRAAMVVVADSTYCNTKSIGSIVNVSINIEDRTNSVMRISSTVIGTFIDVMPEDFIYITEIETDHISWVDANNAGLFKVISKGNHDPSNSSTFYIEVINNNVTDQTNLPIQISEDIQLFSTDGYPQLWKSSYVALVPIESLISNLNSNIANISTSLYKTNKIKITSSSEKNGSISIPVSVAKCSSIFIYMPSQSDNLLANIANNVTDTTPSSFFKRTAPVSTSLDRYTYTDINGPLTSNSSVGTEGTDYFSEIISSTGILTSNNVGYDDIVSFNEGKNATLYRNVKQILPNDSVGTDFNALKTNFDHTATIDKISISKSAQFSADDSIIFVMDKDNTNKTIDVNFSRTCKINSGSQGGSFVPTNLAFSADDMDNESGIDFGSLDFWSKSANNTDFDNYKIWFRARNWYASKGIGSGYGAMIIRNKDFGPVGENVRFSIEYPMLPNLSSSVTLTNNPEYSICSYTFGSGAARTTNIVNGITFTVTSPTTYYYRYAFPLTVDFTAVQTGDIFSATSSSGISSSNCGQFKIDAVDGVNRTIDIYNPNGAITGVGSYEVTSITTTADSIGSAAEYDVQTVADVAGSLHQKYFILRDSNGLVAFWYDVDNVGANEPVGHGANRTVKITTIATGDIAHTVAVKTASYINSDPEFSVPISPAADIIRVVNRKNGVRVSAGSAGTSGFTVTLSVAGVDPISLDGKYFIIYDRNGSVAFWYDVDNDGTIEPIHGANRSVKIYSVVSGDSANTIAAKTSVTINSDSEFAAPAPGANIILVTDEYTGNRSNPSIGTTSFTVTTSSNGTSAISETIIDGSLVNIFPLSGTTVSSIVTTINSKNYIEAVSVVSGTIDTATKEEIVSSVSYDHSISPSSGKNTYVSLFDSETYVLGFNNSNPNFTLKKTLLLEGIAPSVYKMDTAVNYGTTEIGEYFKLIPVSINNIHHQLTQKALSQMLLVSDVDITNKYRMVQTRSNSLGSDGAVEIVGGRANTAEFDLIGDSTEELYSGYKYLQTTTKSYPKSLSPNDIVRLKNTVGVNRYSRLNAYDTFDVQAITDYAYYKYNPKSVSFGDDVNVAITDVSASYSKTAGSIWRWTFDDSTHPITLSNVVVGDMLVMCGNKSRGTIEINGYSGILTVRVGSWTFTAQTGTVTPGTLTFQAATSDTDTALSLANQINSSAASAYVVATINSINSDLIDIVSVNPGTVGNSIVLSFTGTGVILSGSLLSGGYDTVTGWNAGNYTSINGYGQSVYSGFPIISVHPTATKYIDVINLNGVAMTTTPISVEGMLNINPTPIIEWKLGNTTSSKYKVVKMNFKNLVKITNVSGPSPKFLDAGVAVDDLVVISGTTFDSLNNGTFRIRGVDNTSIIIENEDAVNELNTDKTYFNNSAVPVTWTQNYNLIIGIVGAFANLSIGNSIKKEEDNDDNFVQVVNFYANLTDYQSNTPCAAGSATIVSLNNNYSGISSSSVGVSYDTINGVGTGVPLRDIDDIRVYEGDSVRIDDTLNILSVVSSSWFSAYNCGTLTISEIGTTQDFKPYLKILNSSAVSEVNKSISINVNGIFIKEDDANYFDSIRVINHIALDPNDDSKNVVYLTPSGRDYKFTESNGSILASEGKIGYNTDIQIGVDGYLYYTGLLRKVQRTVDGFEPDTSSYPGRRALGSRVETLPPLIRKVSIVLDITTNDGINLNEITNEVKSIVVDYVSNLGIGSDVILSEIIARVMSIRGIAACTFSYPTPSTERIYISDTEKAYITNDDISVA